MSYGAWNDNDLIDFYNRMRLKRAIGSRSKLGYLMGAYAVLGSLGAFGVVCESLNHIPGKLFLVFFICLPGVPLAVYLLLMEQRREQDFKALQIEMQRRGHVW
ncbi:hypothetical protein MJS38_06485, partial [Burkholderia gladioli]